MGAAAMSASDAASVQAKCDFWLAKKNRRCGMLARAGETRCGNHLEHGPERVACAHCKTHVSALGLEKHVRRCPALAQVAARARAPYFVRDVNAGDASAASLAAEVASRPPRGDALRAFAARVRAACANEGVRPGMPFADPRDNERCRLATRARRDARRLAETRGGAVPPPLEPRHAAQHASIAAHMADAGLIRDGSDDEDEDARRTSAAPQKTNDAKTVNNCQKRKPLYAELGAGRGYLSHFLLDAYGPLDLMLVEREPVRFKAERSMGADADKRREAQTRDERRLFARKEKEKETKDSDDADSEIDARAERDAETVRVRRAGAFVERLRIDIKDLDFSGVASARGRDVVFVAKHLCGAATDLALRCALADEITDISEKRESRKETSEKNGGAVKNGARALGACVATCCHHRCEWGSYVNRAFMEAHGFGAREFGWLARISSWAVDGAHAGAPKKTLTKKRRERSPAEHLADDDGAPRDGADVSAREKHELGGMAKTFLDVGRLRFLESLGFEGAVRGYCATEVSPENRLLVVKKKRG